MGARVFRKDRPMPAWIQGGHRSRRNRYWRQMWIAQPAWADRAAIRSVYDRAASMGSGFVVDHIVPLVSPLVCGLHCEANLAVITVAANAAKSNTRWPDMWGEQVGLELGHAPHQQALL